MNVQAISPTFIYGTKRGGTTFLRVLLNGHPSFHIPNESHFLVPLFRTNYWKSERLSNWQMQDVKQIILKEGRFDTWRMTSLELERLIDTFKNKQPFLADIIDKIFAFEVSKHHKFEWGDKTPEYTDCITQIRRLFPAHKSIFIVRDGRDVSNSLKRRGWEGWTIYQRATYWKRSVKQMLASINRNPTLSCLITYEDLVKDRRSSLTRATNFLKLRFHQEMLTFEDRADAEITNTEKVSGIHKALFNESNADTDIQKWRTEQSSTEIFLFEAMAYRELKLTGYDLDHFNVRNPFHQFARLLYVCFGVGMAFCYGLYHKVVPVSIKKRLRTINTFLFIRSIVRNSK